MARFALAPALSLLLGLFAAPPLAAAQEAASAEPRPGRSTTVLTPSVMLSYGGGDAAELGVGAQLRLDHYPTRYSMRTGGLIQAEIQSDGSVRMLGALAGAMWIFGCELGLAYRTDTGRYASSLGLHIGKTVLLGPVSIGGRLTIPLVDFVDAQGERTRVQGLEGAVVLSVGIPSTLDGPEREPFDCEHRRGEQRAPVEADLED